MSSCALCTPQWRAHVSGVDAFSRGANASHRSSQGTGLMYGSAASTHPATATTSSLSSSQIWQLRRTVQYRTSDGGTHCGDSRRIRPHLQLDVTALAPKESPC